MSEEETTCLSGHTVQYISPLTPTPLHSRPTTALSLCGLPPEVKGDKWIEDAKSPHEGCSTRKLLSFMIVLVFGSSLMAPCFCQETTINK